VIRRVSPLLHTPLMSLTNALDAIAVVGRSSWWAKERASWQRSWERSPLSRRRATSWRLHDQDRMLKMFKASGPRKP